MTLYCATTNKGKLREFRLAAETLWGGRFDVLPVPALETIPPAEETGDTFEANAIEKALYYSRHASGFLFADDSGLEVDALGCAPGVRSARYAGEGAGDEANNALLLEKLKGVPQRSARFVCAIALAERGQLVRTFRGAVEGEIIDTPKGPNGFGYDPLFYYEPFGCTFGEATGDRKLLVSHRGQALKAMMDWLVAGGRT